MPGLARQFDLVHSDADVHGTGWPMVVPVDGWFTSGSPDVYVNSRPAVRVGDGGIHVACCGPNTFTAISGSPTVFINSLPAVRERDATLHCGLSPGTVNAGLVSPNTFAN
jgi:uncharacterized Zn-binding protein involved in type VI secretion